MFSAMRRCPASLTRALSNAAYAPRTLQSTISRTSIVSRTAAPRLNTIAIASFHQSAKWQNVAAEATQETQEKAAPITRFADLATSGLVHPNIINTITKKMKLENMTDVQTRTINEALSGVDVYVLLVS